MDSPRPWRALRVRNGCSVLMSPRPAGGDSQSPDALDALDARYHQVLRTNPSPIRRLFYAGFLARYGRMRASIHQFLVLLETLPEENEMILDKVIHGVAHLDACLTPDARCLRAFTRTAQPDERLLDWITDLQSTGEGTARVATARPTRRAAVVESLDEFLRRYRRDYLTRQHLRIARFLLRLARTCGQKHWVSTEVECLRRALRNYEIAVAGPEILEPS